MRIKRVLVNNDPPTACQLEQRREFNKRLAEEYERGLLERVRAGRIGKPPIPFDELFPK